MMEHSLEAIPENANVVTFLQKHPVKEVFENIPLQLASWKKLFVHPDILRLLWTRFPEQAPEARRDVFMGRPVLVVPGPAIIFAIGVGTMAFLRVPFSVLAKDDRSKRMVQPIRLTRRDERGERVVLDFRAGLGDEWVWASSAEAALCHASYLKFAAFQPSA